MTQLLERAIAQLNKTRSIDEQDAIAAMILEKLEDDRHWDESFARSPNPSSGISCPPIPIDKLAIINQLRGCLKQPSSPTPSDADIKAIREARLTEKYL